MERGEICQSNADCNPHSRSYVVVIRRILKTFGALKKGVVFLLPGAFNL